MDILAGLESDGVRQQSLHATAGALRDQVFGPRVFVRGVVEVSNYCRQNCHYCGMRRENRELARYRLELDRLAELILEQRPAILTDIDLQAGEDPVAVRDIVIPLVKLIRQHTNLGVTLCLGTLAPAEYDALRESGAEYYVLKLETTDPAHYAALEAPGTLAGRLAAIRHLAATGWKVSSGIIAGLPGQTLAQLGAALALLHELPLAGSSVSPFIAGAQTPLAGQPTGGLELTLNFLALLRHQNPHWIIPAVSALRSVGRDGYVRALQAGANLATINLTPPAYRERYPIYKRDRNIMLEQGVREAIDQAGLQPSPVGVSEFLRTRAAAVA